MRLLALLVLVFAVAPGCFFSRRNINQHLVPDRIAKLVPGRSTAQDVVDILGAPNEVVQLGRRSAYRYDHTHSREAGLFLVLVFLHGTDVRSDRAWVFFDENLVLTHVGATFDAENATYGIPPFSRGTD